MTVDEAAVLRVPDCRSSASARSHVRRKVRSSGPGGRWTTSSRRTTDARAPTSSVTSVSRSSPWSARSATSGGWARRGQARGVAVLCRGRRADRRHGWIDADSGAGGRERGEVRERPGDRGREGQVAEGERAKAMVNELRAAPDRVRDTATHLLQNAPRRSRAGEHVRQGGSDGGVPGSALRLRRARGAERRTAAPGRGPRRTGASPRTIGVPVGDHPRVRRRDRGARRSSRRSTASSCACSTTSAASCAAARTSRPPRRSASSRSPRASRWAPTRRPDRGDHVRRGHRALSRPRVRVGRSRRRAQGASGPCPWRR